MATGPRFGFYYTVASIPVMGVGLFGLMFFTCPLRGKRALFLFV
jgi:hypothetical protein